MVGVGSGSAMNAFNIGQQATQPTAIGMSIRSIVENADKQGLINTQTAGQNAGAMQLAQFKSDLKADENIGNVYGYDDAGNVIPLAQGVDVTTNKFNPLKQDVLSEAEVDPAGHPVFGPGPAGQAAKEQYFQQNPEHPKSPFRTVQAPEPVLTPEELQEYLRKRLQPK